VTADPRASSILEQAEDAYRRLAELAESIEDEWQYVNDLVEAYGPAILALPLPSGPPADEAVAAIEAAIEEIGLISDPHRAIDWLSTFPHVVALAVGGDVDRATATNGSSGGDEGPDDDSPFAILLRGGR
jgi:hypothetical protein